MKLTPTKLLHWPKATLISMRTKKIWPRTLRKFNFRIPTQVSPSAYKRFILNFKPTKQGAFDLHFSSGGVDGSLILSLSRLVTRPIIPRGANTTNKSTMFSRVMNKIKLRNKNRLFRAKLILTRTIEPEVKLPINREAGAGICAITNLIGPTSRKYENTRALVSELNEELKDNWQNFLINEVSNHARSQGCSAVALLRPENNPDLNNAHLAKYGANQETAESIRSQYYAVARKAGFKKVEGSNYFWKIF